LSLNCEILVAWGPQGGVFFDPQHIFTAIINGTNFLHLFQTAPEGILSNIDNLLCLLETAVGFWGRFTSLERVELRVKKDTSLRLAPNWVNRLIKVEIVRGTSDGKF
jgi:hypothetical protein